MLLSGQGQVNDIFVLGTSIYAATTAGAWVYNGTTGGTPYSTAVLGVGSVGQGIYFDGTNIYVATNGGLSVSSNSGATWTAYTTVLPSTNVLSVFDDGTNVYVGTDAGIAESPNASLPAWTTTATYTISSGLASNTVYGVFVSGGVIYAATAAGLSVFNGTTWTTYLQGTVVYGVSVSGTDIYLATATGVWISLNSGASWSNYTTSQGLASNNVRSISVQ
jgi:ligand-binding sensor domain-containing protein